MESLWRLKEGEQYRKAETPSRYELYNYMVDEQGNRTKLPIVFEKKTVAWSNTKYTRKEKSRNYKMHAELVKIGASEEEARFFSHLDISIKEAIKIFKNQ